MTPQYFKYQDSFWQIFETQDLLGNPMTYAIELDSVSKTNEWASIEATDIIIDKWFLRSDPNDLFDHDYDEQYEKEQTESNPPTVDSSRLKKMLESLRCSDDDDHQMRTVDILDMIRDRQKIVTKTLSKEEQQALNLTNEEYTQLAIDAEYMSLVTKLRV